MPIGPEQALIADVDRVKANDEWLGNKAIISISADNLKNGNGCIEFLSQNHLKVGGWLKGEAKIENSGNSFTFGKYKGKSYQWVKQNEPSYYYWAQENISHLKLP